MSLVHRVLPPSPFATLDDYLKAGGGRGLEAARQVEPVALIDEVEAAGLRGRGGAGFPTGVKWRTVAANRSTFEPTTVVVNAAEGEPGTLKDRTILRYNPYEVLEGAIIAALAVGATSVIIATKGHFRPEIERLRGAIAEVRAAGWLGDLAIEVFEGPEEYLYGEETALLEAVDGRPPFPRIAPPFRRGVDEVVEAPSDLGTDSGLSAHVEMAGPDGEEAAPPTLVDNVETLANVPKIIARGKDWFRTEGTEQSPGTIVATVTGSTSQSGVGEVHVGHAAARSHRAHRRRTGSRTHDQGRPHRGVEHGPHRRSARHARYLRGLSGHRVVARVGQLPRLRRRHRHGGRGRGRVAVPVDRVVRAVRAVQAGWASAGRQAHRAGGQPGQRR